MKDKIKIGIVGYGNLGRGVEMAISQNKDMELVAIFTRRNPEKLQKNNKMKHISDVNNYKDQINVMILCGGSATDLPEQGPMISSTFNTVDSFDNHQRIPEYFETMDKVAKKSNTLSLISVGWDPGLFSLNRALFEAVLPGTTSYTFWGKGVSQGHSDAIRRVEGVKDGIQYTIPIESALEKVRAFKNPEFKANQMHERICYIVLEDGVDFKTVENTIKTMPNYFEGYNTTVYAISEDELKEHYKGMPHGGFVIHSGRTGSGHGQRMEFSLTLEDNPEFTSSVLVAYARAVYRLSKEGKIGACTAYDIPIGYLSPKTPEELRRELL